MNERARAGYRESPASQRADVSVNTPAAGASQHPHRHSQFPGCVQGQGCSSQRPPQQPAMEDPAQTTPSRLWFAATTACVRCSISNALFGSPVRKSCCMGDAHRTQNFTLPIFYRYLRHHDPGFASQQRGLNLRNARTRVSQNRLHAVELCRGTNRGVRRKDEVWIAQVNLDESPAILCSVATPHSTCIYIGSIIFLMVEFGHFGPAAQYGKDGVDRCGPPNGFRQDLPSSLRSQRGFPHFQPAVDPQQPGSLHL